MTFAELAKQRFSSRNYQNKTVEPEKIKAVLEAARIAPSAANKQPWVFYVANTPKSLSLLAPVYHRQWYKEAPVVIVACANHNMGWVRASDNKDHCDIDLAIAIDHMTLQATDLGLGTCWICNFDVKLCRELLQLEAYIEPVALLTLAYPADRPDTERHTPARKKLDEIVKWLDV